MNRGSRYSQLEPARTYHDGPETSPDLPQGPSARTHYAQEPRYRDSLDAPPRGYGYAAAAEPARGQQGGGGYGYDNPFASREQLPPLDPGEFNVEDDFNNVGPRYAEVYGIERQEAEANKPVRPKSSVRPKSFFSMNGATPSENGTPSLYGGGGQGYSGDTKSTYGGRFATAGGVELVTVPALGADWTKDEVHALSKRGRKELAAEDRQRTWRSWLRDERGTCGVKWLTRRTLVIALFVLVIATAITLILVIPRVPNLNFPSNDIFTVDNSTIVFSRSPTNFTYTAHLNLLADTSSSYVPVHLKGLYATVYDLNTHKVIGTGNVTDYTLKKGNSILVGLPVQMSYTAVNTSDTTWNDMYNACGHLWPGTTRPDLQFSVQFEMRIAGLLKSTYLTRGLTDIACPFELSAQGV